MARFDYVYNLGADSLRFKRHACKECGCGVAEVSIYYEENKGNTHSALNQLNVTGPMAAALWEMLSAVCVKDSPRFTPCS